MAEHRARIAAHPIERRDLRDDDLAVRVDYCDVCHSDLHALHGMVGKPTDGLVPGHEFTGAVTAVGAGVTGFAPGDPVAVGTIADELVRHRRDQAHGRAADLRRRAGHHRRHRAAAVHPGRRGLTRLEKGDVRYRFVMDLSDLD